MWPKEALEVRDEKVPQTKQSIIRHSVCHLLYFTCEAKRVVLKRRHIENRPLTCLAAFLALP